MIFQHSDYTLNDALRVFTRDLSYRWLRRFDSASVGEVLYRASKGDGVNATFSIYSLLQYMDERVSLLRDEADTVDMDEDLDWADRMDGDHESALASAGWGTDEDYGYFGEDY